MELAEALLHTLNVVGEETGKEKEGTGRLPAKSHHLAGFSAIARTQREIKIPPPRLLGVTGDNSGCTHAAWGDMRYNSGCTQALSPLCFESWNQLRLEEDEGSRE